MSRPAWLARAVLAPPKPFLAPALKRAQKRIVRRIVREVQREVEEHRRRAEAVGGTD